MSAFHPLHPVDAQAVRDHTHRLLQRKDTREGVTHGPHGTIKTFEVSSWLQIPHILKALETEGANGIRLTFPKKNDAVSKEIHDFIKNHHSKPSAEMLVQLAAKIESSKDFEDCKYSLKVKNGAQWISAFNLDRKQLDAKLEVATVVKTNAASKRELHLKVANAASTQSEVIFEVGSSQGEVSKLFSKLRGLKDYPKAQVWVGCSTQFPGDPLPSFGGHCEEFELAKFRKIELEKLPSLKALRKFLRDSGLTGSCNIDEIDAFDLRAKDRTGKTVLDNLMRIHAAIDVSDPVKKELQSHFLAAAIERLYHPGFAKQDQHGACGAESILRLTAFRNVGEWAKLAADLTVDRKSKIADTITLEPAKDWVYNDKSTSRTAFDALLQSALMRFTASNQGCEYRNVDDKFVKSDGTEIDGGMTDPCAGKLISALVREVSTSVDRAKLGTNPAQQLGDLASRIGGVYVGLKWPDPDAPSGQGEHAVIVQGYDSKTDTVIFSNPHGETAGKANGDVLTEPARTIVDNAVGVQAMSAALFNTELLNAILPA